MDNKELEGIAIIGMEGQFPSADNVREFWQMIIAGQTADTDLTEQQLEQAGVPKHTYTQPDYVRKNYIVQHADRFDAAFFEYSPREAETTDPQHRLLLETSYAALENAGYDPSRYPGRIGTILGVGKPIYTFRNVLSQKDILDSVGVLEFYIRNEKSFAVSKIAYKLGLTGPSMAIDTACSTSLVAVHQACQSLLSYECDMMLAGGVSLNLPIYEGYQYLDGGILSRDGYCRPFDELSSGTTNGGGCGVVVLKRLQDAIEDNDHIIAVIKGSAINNDGKRKISYTAPSFDGQVSVIQDALLLSGIEPADVGYIEAHGTGTKLGDPLEMAALATAYALDQPEHAGLVVGSVKSNIGHLDIAAGVASLIKTALSLQHRVLPPTANFRKLNPAIDDKQGKMRVLSTMQAWHAPEHSRCAAVTSLGIGGTNCHLIMQEATPGLSDPGREHQLIILSAKSPGTLHKQINNLSHHLLNNPTNLADVAFTLQVGRQQHSHRAAFVCSKDNVQQVMHTAESKWAECKFPPMQIAFLFPGQGSQYTSMGKQLFQQEPVFASTLEFCFSYLQQQFGFNLANVMWNEQSPELINQTQFAQLSIFCLSYSYAKLLDDWGIQPDVMLGHSIGEYVAACLCGVMSLTTALQVVYHRSRLMSTAAAGKMSIVALPAEQVRQILAELQLMQCCVAVDNSAELCVIAGPEHEIAIAVATLSVNANCHPLHTSHAFHSVLMEPVLEGFRQVMRNVELSAPVKPFMSNLSGDVITAEQAQDPEYWVQHLRNPVRFREGIQAILQTQGTLCIEVGAGTVLSSLVRQQAPAEVKIISCGKHAKDSSGEYETLLSALGQLWCSGVTINWQALHSQQKRLRVPLPGYPFSRTRHWLNAPGETLPPMSPEEEAADSEQFATASQPCENWVEELIHLQWSELLGLPQISTNADFFLVGGHSLLASTLIAKLNNNLGVNLNITDIFEYPSIKSLADYIIKSSFANADETELSAMLDELETISDPYIFNALDEEFSS